MAVRSWRCRFSIRPAAEWAQQGGDVVQAGGLGSAPPALAGDDLIVAWRARVGSGEQGLQDAAGFDGLDQVGEAGGIDRAAWLIGAWFEAFDGQGGDAIFHHR
jgi:hypothetical protein